MQPQLDDGFDIDIFIHTWDEYEPKLALDGKQNPNNTRLINKPLLKEDIDRIEEIYKPKKMLIEHLDAVFGWQFSIEKTNKLREEYEKENNFKYDYLLCTRLDIGFLTPFRIQKYMDIYKSHPEFINFPMDKFCFACSDIFTRLPLYDYRHANEADIFWFSNYTVINSIIAKPILMDYELNSDLFIVRAGMKFPNPQIIKANRLKNLVNNTKK